MELFLAAFLIYIVASCQHSATALSSYTHYRLPVSLQPDRYQLRIITHLENVENLTFDGQVSIRFLVLEDTNIITLHAGDLIIDDSRIQLKSYEDDDFRLCLDGVETVPEQDIYIIRLCQSLRKGQVYKVKLEFSGIVNDGLIGYYSRSYVDKASNGTKWLSATHFEPTYARRAFPCFDEPNYKATFVIWLGHHKSLTALSNMPREKQIPIDDLEGYVWSIFEESVPMSTYLVAYTVNDFVFKDSHLEGSDVVFRTWCRRNYIDKCEYASELAPKMLQYYEDMYGIPFPLKKMDQIFVPDFIGDGMENWGLIIYKEKLLSHDHNVLNQLEIDANVRTISHEMAHQWFGNLVTMKWWTDVWLNEGFATYVSSLPVQQLMPELQMYLRESIGNSLLAFGREDEFGGHAMSQPILNAEELMEHFADTTIYYKASSVIRMMHSFLGQDDFFEGIRNYLTKHKYKNAEQDDLWAAFTEIAHKNNRIQPQHDLKTTMDSWTLQPGYPLVNVSRNYETGSIEISQQRFFGKAEADKCWWVPLSYTTASELDFVTTTPKAWLECDVPTGKSVNLKLDNVTNVNEWIIFNIQLSGFYRVMYDTNNWRLIQKTLNSDSFTDIHVMNRVQILEDILSFARNNYVDYEIAFDILEYLTREREYQPWEAAVHNLDELLVRLERFHQHQSYFKAYMRYIVEPMYSYVNELKDTKGTKTKPTYIALLNLVSEWACRVDLEDCVQTAIDYFRQWKLTQNPDEVNKIPVDRRTTVYCTAIRHGNQDDWTFLWQRFVATKSETQRKVMIDSLGCSRNATVLSHFLHIIFHEDTQLQEWDILPVCKAVLSSNIGFALVLEFYIEHMSELDADSVMLALWFDLLSSDIFSTEDQNKFINLIESNREYFKEFENEYADAVAKMNTRIAGNFENITPEIQRRLAVSNITQQ